MTHPLDASVLRQALYAADEEVQRACIDYLVARGWCFFPDQRVAVMPDSDYRENLDERTEPGRLAHAQ